MHTVQCSKLKKGNRYTLNNNDYSFDIRLFSYARNMRSKNFIIQIPSYHMICMPIISAD